MVSSTKAISDLRIHVSSHAEDARPIALLANLLVERAKLSRNEGISSSGASNDSCYEEAVSLAKASIKLAPEDAIGYGVLSTIPILQLRERMSFLRTAVDLEQESLKKRVDNVSSQVVIALSLVRLLIEPREEMARINDEFHAKTTMRQDLCVNKLTGLDERSIYEELKIALETSQSIIWKRRENRWQTRQTGQEANSQLANAFSSIPPTIQNLAIAHYRLGRFFRTMRQDGTTHHPTAKYHFSSVLELLNPPYMNASYKLQSQIELYDMTVKSKFWLATLEQDVPLVHSKTMQVDRCPKEYVTSLYSSFAANFDNQLVKKLKYKTPAKLRELLDSAQHVPGTRRRFSHGADLGCGTGLSGVAFRDLIEFDFVGVDLSSEMVDKAKERGCYDHVFVGDVESILTDPHCEGLDLIVACDVFVYIGNLLSVFESVANRLTPKHGLFVFSTELLVEEQDTVENRGFVLQSCARFAHKQSYVRNLADECGFVVRAMTVDVIRKNGGQDVSGI
eukprot:CAMPEP_0172565572 /NCGR_PEP_ID=MMETSP1067-20121228/108729_1 /TAXON_ID=265564 ORGANISM="Thalassiosira punctigera, Strain Tpunct2005C2" /NCGR_SAMPLE_ID=MMETSP1067 /ASSEMBLY_ACC=CAM_ASM_000444 /LENGTH=507 /DNA_ID=CAMNT_0013356485 /DNA_START=96 /DNA_END=1616 /DNA_ORIENTATION=-